MRYSEAEKEILKRHQIIPVDEIYHLTNNLSSIQRTNALFPKARGMLSLTANPKLQVIFPETEPRKFRLVLDFQAVKKHFDIFPVYYFTEKEFYEEIPHSWLVEYYRKKGLAIGELETWNSSIIYVSAGKPLGKECEWKSLRAILPLDAYLIRIEMVRHK